MKAVIDKDIPYIKGVLEPWFETLYLKGREISREAVSDADVLIVRTRTRCDASLLEGSQVGLVCTATIGTDHIDMEWCASAGIDVKSAPGCNSEAVKRYVWSAIDTLSKTRGFDMKGKTIGVVGVGNVGSKVADYAAEYGMKALRNDPPRERAENLPKGYFTPLDKLLEESDVVTLHIPLEKENLNFANDRFFDMMRPGAIFINASRGEVVDEEALLRHREKLGALVVDVWKGEPDINGNLLAAADIATPHIAGYSVQGKINGTVAVVRAVGERFSIPELSGFSIPSVEGPFDPTSYDIMADDASLRSNPGKFEELRGNYKYRI